MRNVSEEISLRLSASSILNTGENCHYHWYLVHDGKDIGYISSNPDRPGIHMFSYPSNNYVHVRLLGDTSAIMMKDEYTPKMGDIVRTRHVCATWPGRYFSIVALRGEEGGYEFLLYQPYTTDGHDGNGCACREGGPVPGTLYGHWWVTKEEVIETEYITYPMESVPCEG